MKYDAADRFRARMLNPWKLGLYMLFKLPLGLMAGLRITALDAQHCIVTLPYGWRTTNPFKSTYFAAQTMAAELSTGALVMAALEEQPLKTGMLVTRVDAHFSKRAIDRISFTCFAGEKISDAIAEAKRSSAPVVFDLESVGCMPDGTEVSRFSITWSIIARA